MTDLQRCLISWIEEGFARKPWRNQAWLAHEAGLSQKHVSQMMTGQVMGALSTWDRLLEIVEVRDEAVMLANNREHTTLSAVASG